MLDLALGPRRMTGGALGLVLLGALLNGLDNWTTWVCLRNPIPGVYEANPMARWTFELIGLGPSLILEYTFTLIVAIAVARTSWVSQRNKLFILGAMCLLSGYAALNNLGIMVKLDLLG